MSARTPRLSRRGLLAGGATATTLALGSQASAAPRGQTSNNRPLATTVLASARSAGHRGRITVGHDLMRIPLR